MNNSKCCFFTEDGIARKWILPISSTNQNDFLISNLIQFFPADYTASSRRQYFSDIIDTVQFLVIAGSSVYITVTERLNGEKLQE